MSNEELQLISEVRGGVRLMGRDSADEPLLAADGGRVRRLDGRDLWIHRQQHMMDELDEEPEEQRPVGDERGLSGRDLFVYRTAHAFEQSQPDPEKVNLRYQRHIERIRAVNQRRRERGEHVIPSNFS